MTRTAFLQLCAELEARGVRSIPAYADGRHISLGVAQAADVWEGKHPAVSRSSVITAVQRVSTPAVDDNYTDDI